MASCRVKRGPACACGSYTGSWYGWATFSIVGASVYSIGIPAVIFGLTYRYHKTKPSDRGGLGRHISLLLSSYRDKCWWFETVDMLRKFLLASVVLVVGERTTLRTLSPPPTEPETRFSPRTPPAL